MENKYNLIIVGSGPGGYVAAIRASQLGKSVAVVEKLRPVQQENAWRLRHEQGVSF